MPSKPFGFEANTMLSTLDQLCDWAGEGRQVTPAQIMAMLDVEPPTGLDVGAWAEVSVSVPNTNPIR